jgi:hypothetical protein
MKLVYCVTRNEWFDNAPDNTDGVEDFDDLVEAIKRCDILNKQTPQHVNVEYYVRVFYYWSK